ncbi:MAG: DNA helicase I [Cytophagales bacterium CG12_big_fil_rev_8_21_14_0_65_40_12]|nr:MAG: DNA helicase I [Cytophagales bacterium CG12_big_fil_rev_8_21_14_0_65_40_12]PIW05255.1 MAG: DNA helicase I [Cytophagales bacterium CG17_big_fil_post_rev_8_21_14_2_50_40_13]
MQHILQSYLRRLTNLSANNRSLVLLRLLTDQFIDLHDFDFLDLKPSFRVLEDVIAQKSSIKLIPNSDSRDANSNKIATRMAKLRRREQFIFEETGGKDLYVGWPFVHGKLNDGTIVRAPLIFFPMSLELEQNEWLLKPRKEVNTSLNKSFLLAFAHYNKIKIDEELLDRSFDDFDADSTVFRTQLYELLEQSNIAIRFGREIFADKLTPFSEFTKDSFEKANDNGKLSLISEAVLGIFPQADSYLIPDYEFLIEHLKSDNFEDFFAQKNLSEQNDFGADFDAYRYFLDKVKEEETYTPFRKDAFQENAIKAVKKGNSMVVQGPPGTGKSQLICNLISDYMARGKKVLLVSQKRAALDVVYQRLKEQGINEFVALVHDFKNDRKEVYDKIANQIERLNEYKRNNTNLDAIQLDRSFKQASRTIDDLSEVLEDYKKALFDDQECGLSVKELYLTSYPEQETVTLVQEYHYFDFREQAFEKDLKQYFDYALRLNKEGYPWAERVDFADFKINDLKKMQGHLDEIPIEAQQYVDQVSEVIGEAVDFDACRTMGENLDRLRQFNELLQNEEIYALLKPMIGEQNKESDLLWLANSRILINACFDMPGIETSLTIQEIPEVQILLKQRANARKSFIKSIKWSFSKEKLRLARILVANGLTDTKEQFQILDQRIDHRLNLQHQLTKLKNADWIATVPNTLSKKEINLWLDKLEIALKAKLIFASFANFKEYFPVKKFTSAQLKKRIKTIISVLKDLPKKREQWNKYILPIQIDHVLRDPASAKEMKKTLLLDFDSICELDQLVSGFSEAQISGIKKLEDLGIRTASEYFQIFENSLRLAWIDHIESKYPVLRTVSTLKFEQMLTDLQQAEHEKLEASTQILLQRAREKTYEPAEYNRLNNMVTYRDLQHQVNKKRRIWPMRKLVSNFHEELFNLVPCWMASPESVSAIFPMETFFDLVIFDEASQCFAEKGLPAIYRGKQLVIAGDSQQLRPNDLYRVKWDDEQEELALEVESLLELANNYLMQVHLQGHYRSQSLALIDFSNQHFYKGKLQMLPHFKHINDQNPAIDFIKVEGVWEHQSNEIEAEAVIALLKDLEKEASQKTVGIVTFNASQQSLIQDKIEEAGIELKGLFVKNIENVQGDERDIIIFSTAYGPDKKGKLNLHFGSLNAAGGENRLNVAITRAKEKVIIITSLLPENLKVDQLKNEGPKLLKAYLSFARTVADGDFKPAVYPSKTFSQHWYLKERLKLWEKEFDLKFTDELPFADLSIKRKSDFKAVLLTDDNVFYESITIKDSFVYKPFLLESKAWNYRFVHSRNYWLTPQRMKENIGRLVAKSEV